MTRILMDGGRVGGAEVLHGVTSAEYARDVISSAGQDVAGPGVQAAFMAGAAAAVDSGVRREIGR